MQCALLELLKSPVLVSMQVHKGWKRWAPTTEAQETWDSITIHLWYFPHILPTGNIVTQDSSHVKLLLNLPVQVFRVSE